MSNNAIVCSIYKYNDYDVVSLWINSIRSTGFDGDIVVVALNIPENLINFLKDNKIIVHEYHDNSNIHPNVLRFKYIHNALANSNYNKVVLTDARDVVFQKNPFNHLEMIQSNYKIVASSENVLFKDNAWIKDNMINTFGIESYISNEYNEAVCAGVLAGEKNNLSSLCLDIYNLSMTVNSFIDLNSINTKDHWSGWSKDPADQAALNILIHNKWKDLTKILSLDSSWCINLGISNEINKELLLNNLGYLDNDSLKNSMGEDFFIVHQYDRIKEYNDIFVRKYGN